MRNPTLLIGAAIFPLAVVAATPATTTIGPISGDGQTTVTSGEGVPADSFAVRRRAKNTSKGSLSRRAREIRPRTNRMGFQGEGGQNPET